MGFVVMTLGLPHSICGEGVTDWQLSALRQLSARYLPALEEVTVSQFSQHLERLASKLGERMATRGIAGVPAADLATLALLVADHSRQESAPGERPDQFADPSVREKDEDQERSDLGKGGEGIRQASDRFSEMPLTERLVITGDITSGLQAATVPQAPELTSTFGRARLNFVGRTTPSSSDGSLKDGYFFVQMLAAGGPFDSSAVGGPASFTAFNDVATDRSPFNEGTSRGNIYLNKAFYEQEVQWGAHHVVGRGGVVDLSDFFDANEFANNESRQFMNSAFVNGGAFKTGIGAPGAIAEYRRGLDRGWLEGAAVRLGYAVSQTQRAFSSPIWIGEAELQTKLGGRIGHWRLGTTAGNLAGVGSIRGLHVSMDQWISSSLGIFGRYGFNNSSPGSLAFGPIKQAYSGGFQRRFVDRKERVSAWAIGFSQGFGISPVDPLASERILETYYRWQASHNFSVTPDFQLILGSGGRKEDDAQAVLGLRLNVDF